MKRFVVIALLLVLAGAVLWWRLNESPPPPKGAELLPDSTVLLVTVPDFSRLREDFPKTEAYALWREPEVQRFAQELNRAFAEWLGAPKGSRRPPSLVAPLFEPARGEVFFAVTDAAFQPRPGFRLVLGMDVGGNRLGTWCALRYREFRIRSWNRTARFYTKRHAAQRYRVWELNPQWRIYHAFFHSLLVYTHDEQTLCAMLERFRGQTESRPLADSPTYRALRTQLRPDPEWMVYVNPQQLRPLWPCGDAKPTAMDTTFVGTQMRDLQCTLANGSPTATLRRDTLRFTSPQTSFYHLAAIDWGNAYQQFAETLAASGNRVALARLAQFEQMLRRNDIRPTEDVFRRLGPETALLAEWREGARLPDAAVVIELQEVEPLRGRLGVAMTAAKQALTTGGAAIPWDFTQFHDVMLRTWRLPTSVLAPTYFVAERFLVIASSPDYARELIGRLKEPGRTLADAADYREAMKRLPPDASGYTYCDLRAISRSLWPEMRRGLEAGPNPLIRPEQVPATETVVRHLSPFVSATLVSPNGQKVVTISPLGKPATYLLGAVAAWWAIHPHLGAIPIAPTKFSNTASPLPPSENQTAGSQTPSR